MRIWVKIGLFLSSYIPLFLILFIKNWFNLYLTILFIFVTIYSLVWIILLNILKKDTSESFTVIKSKNKTKESLEYLIPYIISFIGFDFSKWQDWSSLFILLTILLVVYLNSDLIYTNPMLSFFKFKLFQIEICKPVIDCEKTKSNILLLTKKNTLKTGEKITVKDIDGTLFLEVI